MTDKVQKIREWVKARLDENSSKQSLPQFYCMMEEDARFLGFLYFLDTMQEEHDEIVDKYLYGKEPELVDADDLPKEEPVSDDLEEAADNALSNVLNTHKIVNVRSCLEMFRLGAKWQKQKDNNNANHALVEQIKTQQMCYEKGIADMRQQMMAKAIDGDITFDYYGNDDKTYGCIAHDSFCLEDFGLKDRDVCQGFLCWWILFSLVSF